MQSHPLDGDGLNVELFKLLGRVSRISVVNEALPFRIPDTILYYGCASYWYFFDEQTNSVQKHPAKSLEKTNVFERFCQRSPTDRTDIVACFCSSRTESMDIKYMDRDGLWKFLFTDKRQERYGILQKFVEPKTEHCETVQVVHSPTMTFAVRRQNRAKLYDRAVDIDLRCCGFDGPSYQCEEYFCLQNRTGAYRHMCEAFVKFFTGIEPRFLIKRLVVYFRHGADDFNYLMFTSSVRIVERVDPELEQLWGKKVVPFAALKQSLGNVATTWNPSSTTSSTAKDTAAAPDTARGQGPAATNANGSLSSKLLQPLCLLPKEQLDKMSTVPSRAKEIEALAKHYQRGSHGAPKKLRPVPRRLLSPFQTVSTLEAEDSFDQSSEPSLMATKLHKIRALRKRAAKLDEENESIRKKLESLQRDAASLCMMNELDKILHRKLIAEDDSESDGLEDGSESGSVRPFGAWPARVDSVVSVTSDFDSTQNATVSDLSVPVELASVPSPMDGEGQDATKPTTAARVKPSGDGSAAEALSRTASVVGGGLRMRMYKRKSIVGGQKKDPVRQVWSPRSYKSRAALATLQRALTEPLHEFVKERVSTLMHTAAVLSDLFYPLAETVATRRKWIPKYLRYESTYGEDEGIIHVAEDGSIRFSMPRDILLAVKRELGAYWSTLKIEIADEEMEHDGPLIPSHLEWQEIEAARLSDPNAGSDEVLLALPQRQVKCSVRPPYPNQSAFTFASRKLQEIAEQCETSCRAYREKVINFAPQHAHFDLMEGIVDGFAAYQQRQYSKGTSAQMQQQPSGYHQSVSPSPQELNPAANRGARRTSMLQQLRGLAAKTGANNVNDGAHTPVTGDATLDLSSAPVTPKSQRTPSHTSSTPSEEPLITERRLSLNSDARAHDQTAQSSAATTTVSPDQPTSHVGEGTGSESSRRHHRPHVEFVLETPPAAVNDDVPEWLR